MALLDPQLAKWEQRHSEAEDNGQPPQVLLRHLHLLPGTGRALDLACGRGAGAVLLAEQGLETTGWDFSAQAIKRLKDVSHSSGLNITTEVRDIIANPPPVASYDLILVSYFFDRSLFPAIVEALRPGGLLLYETFSQTAVSDRGPSGTDWRLADNELLDLCKGLRIHYYKEEARMGDLEKGSRDIAMIIASKT